MINLEVLGYHRYYLYMNKFGQIFIKDKFLKFVICLMVLLVCNFNSPAVFSQIYYYQDDSENPFQYYSRQNDYNYGNSAPNQYYYYNSPDPDQLIDQINQLFKNMFGEKFDSDDDFKFSYPIPKQLQDRFGLLDKYNKNNNEQNDISPAPEYSQNPDIYY